MTPPHHRDGEPATRREAGIAAGTLPGAVPGEQPDEVEPQLAVANGDLPAGRWMFERKLDGYRILVHVRDGRVRLQSRNHQPYAEHFPELVAAVREATSQEYIADAEVVAFDDGETSFAALQSRMGRGAASRGISVRLYVFDLLYLDGYDLRGVRLLGRKQLLWQVMTFDGPLRFTDHVVEDTSRATVLLEDACRGGWEGLIAKDPESRYRAGRAPSWRKLPCLRSEAFVVCGFTEPSGARTGFGALHVGYHDPSGQLRYAGKVGAGFDERHLTTMRTFLERIRVPRPPVIDPPRDRASRWVEPLVVVEVTYVEWTSAGRLRHPRFRSVLADIAPGDVVRHTPPRA